MTASTKESDVDYVEFENATDRRINLHIDWIEANLGFKNETIQAGDTVQIQFGTHQGRICHQSDDGTPALCSFDSPIAKAGDYYTLELNGGFSG